MRMTTDTACILNLNLLEDRFIEASNSIQRSKPMKMCYLLKLGGRIKFPNGP